MNSQTLIKFSKSTSYLVIFVLFPLLHRLPCTSSKQELGVCESPFQCGEISAGFPFWGGNRPENCGLPLLELHCRNKSSTYLIISDQEYSVLKVSRTNYTITLARPDLLGRICSAKFNTTALPSDIFEILPAYKELEVYYLCDRRYFSKQNYTCPSDKGLVLVFEEQHGELHCNNSFTVIVRKSFVPLEEDEFDSYELERVIRNGFEVKVKIDEKNVRLLVEYAASMVQLRFAARQTHHPQESAANQSVNVVGGLLYPFWIPGREECGHPDFKLNCNGGFAELDISSITRRFVCYCGHGQCNHTGDSRNKGLGAEVKRITKSFAEMVGKGGFGNVYRGTLSDGRIVAVKILKDSKSNGEDFINEVASISRTSHVNIVTLLGFCSEGSKRAIIYEFLENGSLDKFISSKRSSNMDWKVLYEIALGVARGLEYLHHGCRTRIVHFDIKPQNVLLDNDLCPKVSDFGLAKLCERKESMLSLLDTRGTIGYIAPEVFSRVYGRVSHKSDVYSYGMLVLEMIGARNKDRDAQEVGSSTSSMYFPEWIYRDLEKGDNGRLLENGINSEEEEEIAKKMTMVGLWCIQAWPSNRPPMNRVIEMMEGDLNALEFPPKPAGFPASRIIPWIRLGSGPASPGRFFPEPKGPVPTLVTGMSSSPPAGVEPGSMTIGPQGSNQ
uniref:Protein kinase domain-containing protein n=1 Tax=Brassica oleracea var. oleracea TaxID=109376 RepID=A0A0D3CYJ6_BRAOL